MDNKMLCPKTVKLVNQVFGVFYAICNGFEKQFAENKKLELAKTQWIIAFMESGIKYWHQVEPAIKQCRKKQGLIYIPTIGDFLTMCENVKIENFLTKEQAYTVAYDYMRNETPQELSQEQINILEHAIRSTGRNFLKTNSRNATQPVFFRNYEIALRNYLEGELKPIPKAIEVKTKTKKPEVLPDYQNLKSREQAMPVIKKLMQKMRNKNFIGD